MFFIKNIGVEALIELKLSLKKKTKKMLIVLMEGHMVYLAYFHQYACTARNRELAKTTIATSLSSLQQYNRNIASRTLSRPDLYISSMLETGSSECVSHPGQAPLLFISRM